MLAMSSAWQIAEVPFPRDVARLAGALAGGGELAWLDSTADVAGHPRGAELSLIASEPLAVLEQYEGRAGDVDCRRGRAG